MKYAALRDPVDSRDMPFEQIESALRQKAGLSNGGTFSYIIPEYTPISNQGQVGSCVANAWADAMEIVMGVQGLPVVQLSRLYLYWLARSFDKTTTKDEGTTMRAAAYQLKKIGICPEEFWPYEERKVLKAPPLECTTLAADNRIKGYYRITAGKAHVVDAIELAVRANHPVVFRTDVGPAFENFSGKGVLFPEKETEGGHAMLVHGVAHHNGRRQFWVRNSWGKDWGDDGHAWFDESYFTAPFTYDMWVGTHMEPVVV